ncbi:hypothetical protein BD779DRAFT_1536361 [Infundibulicybe gibba]|nr:hypothetical protein BD779DRAFT_1536361 [Infundibulicybe gibba]
MHPPVVSLLLLALPLAAIATPPPRSFFRRSFDPNSVPAQCTSACAPLTSVYNVSPPPYRPLILHI